VVFPSSWDLDWGHTTPSWMFLPFLFLFSPPQLSRNQKTKNNGFRQRGIAGGLLLKTSSTTINRDNLCGKKQRSIHSNLRADH
jgi:hypothetical protein